MSRANANQISADDLVGNVSAITAFETDKQAPFGGIIVATVLTLLFLPALYAAWFRVKRPAAEAAQVQHRQRGCLVDQGSQSRSRAQHRVGHAHHHGGVFALSDDGNAP